METSKHQIKRNSRKFSKLKPLHNRIVELYESGTSMTLMSKLLKVSLGSLKEYLITKEIHQPKRRYEFTDKESTLIVSLRKKGHTVKDIALELNRSEGVVKQKLRQIKKEGEL